jgi:hypothetical protein
VHAPGGASDANLDGLGTTVERTLDGKVKRPGGGRRRRRASAPAALAVLSSVAVLAASSCRGPGKSRTASPSNIPDPAHTVAANPDFSQACSPSGPDSSLSCAQVTLQAIDNARAREGVKPMVLPSDFTRLTMAEQLLVAVDGERVDRGLAPLAGLTDGLDGLAQRGADAAGLPKDPGRGYTAADTEWIGGVANGLAADYEWMYDDGPGSGIDGCPRSGGSGCWADRHVVLDDLGAGGTPVMGAAVNPTGDTSPDDKGGPSLAAIFALTPVGPGSYAYTWAQAQSDEAAGTIRPRTAPPTNTSATHIADPGRTVPPAPDYTRTCAGAGLDSSPPCLDAVVEAVDAARAAEGVKPIALPSGFDRLPVPQQLFVAVDLERVDRGLPPVTAMTAALDRNAQRGADQANDPPDPGGSYGVVDTEWAGGSANGLDAVYGWMYDDGPGSTNLDCPKAGGPGCWGHRHGILDDFGTVGTLLMGAAINPTGDTNAGDKGGTSMAATLAVTSNGPGPVVYTWAQAVAGRPPG